jgi:hypothetical protein
LLAGGSRALQQYVSQNIFRGFSFQLLGEALGISAHTSQRLSNQNDQRGEIIRVNRALQFLQPIVTQQQEQKPCYQVGQSQPGLYETWQSQVGRSQTWQSQEGQSSFGFSNGLEENFCDTKPAQNIENPSRADTYNPRAGRITRLNSQSFPILNAVQMSATRVNLYQVLMMLHFHTFLLIYLIKFKIQVCFCALLTYCDQLQNAILSPFWNINAHSVMYTIQGHVLVQVVDNHGQTVFDGILRPRQLLIIPQNYIVLKKAQREGSQYISFRTNANSMVSYIAGKNSILRALPVDVIANAYRISRQEAQNLKYNRGEEFGAFSPKFSQIGFQSYPQDITELSSIDKA